MKKLELKQIIIEELNKFLKEDSQFLSIDIIDFNSKLSKEIKRYIDFYKKNNDKIAVNKITALFTKTSHALLELSNYIEGANKI